MKNKPIPIPVARYGYNGSLILDIEVPGITKPLENGNDIWYGPGHFVCDQMSEIGAYTIARSMGWNWIGKSDFKEDKIKPDHVRAIWYSEFTYDK